MSQFKYCLILLAFVLKTGCATAPTQGLSLSGLDASIKGVIQQAREKKLADQRYWKRLLHMNHTSSPKSEVRGDFFIHPQGNQNPQAELEATLKAFFMTQKEALLWEKKRFKELGILQKDPTEKGQKGSASQDQAGAQKLIKSSEISAHPICRFPARFVWLMSHLPQLKSIKAVQCPRLTEFLVRTRLKSATLVFSAHHLKAPASAYGHTFLRLNHAKLKDRHRYEKGHALIDTGVGYSAEVDETSPILYAAKGLLGLFKGTFTVYPYYYKVREYNDFEARDLWEYDLNLTPQEVSRIALHLWEMGRAWAPYLYLSKNCSYELLRLLEIARPTVSLLDQLHWPVLPADTIQVAQEANLITSTLFRPSIRTVLNARLSTASSEVKSAALDLPEHDQELKQLEPDQQAQALDIALDHYDLLHAQEMVKGMNDEIFEKRQSLLEKRALLSARPLKLNYDFLRQDPPEAGHDSRRVEIQGGWSPHEGESLHLNARLNLHSLTDPPYGYPSLLQLQFFSLKSRYLFEHNTFKISQLTLIDALSLSRFHVFEPRPSWNIQMGMREKQRQCVECLVGYLDFHAGLTLATLSERVSWVMFSSMSLEGGPSVETTVPLTFGLGGSTGLRIELSKNAVLMNTLNSLYWFFEKEWSTQGRSILRWGLFKNFAWTIEGRLLRVDWSSKDGSFLKQMDWQASSGFSFYF